ncbi:23S rRNA pseudouridine1911/1915/1917 synthase [Dysgonomonas sp. PH5-45]|uniref:RluA family pseudouridine synthase n=1 Tax=unclassified Dysgonomonas TaxID=2630389 RepID=UPI002474B055|nr:MULTISPECIES: RluA family pseudouridine synthase [unclassified Dysgonomonas]MDH6355515.1 23S rRNA pseudouridine1911/1915/1917 synthase [Dysgonomonas sp. PH5-45]MDH6388424.1 23S rRNA pseudouridine1911/1915/1917 synthase [Dysgonomonas sp. PH5-37]
MKKENTEAPLQTLKVEEATPLMTYLVEKKIRKSRNAIKSLFAHKQIKVNGRTTTQFDHPLAVGDVVTIHKTNKAYDTKLLKGVKIVYEDEFLLVVEKDAKLLSVATDRERSETAYSIINDYIKIKAGRGSRVFVLHRLDRDASGLMLFAKSAQIQELFQRTWNDAIITRSFIAVVRGRITPPEGTIISWLTEDKKLIMHSSETDNGGQRSVTHYKTVKNNRKYTMLRLEAETGRKNQLRVQLQSVGHSIVGDRKYGSTISPIKRMALHANELVFRHPATGEILEFKSPVPENMQRLVEVVKVEKEK